ncbi:MAG TPA: DUF1501 domain-containing protein [Gemmataceae bacterium]|jgi:hypothetical protein|nr:DUF1501 domain-containing protein [Gemmataceae bacterium]
MLADPRLSRRSVLQAGAATALGLFWTDWLRAEAVRPAAGKAKAVILIFNAGAPSHIDLWDPKPAAPETVRGPFAPIATTVPGLRVTRLLPQLAKLAHRYAVVRTVHHSHTQHNSGMHWSIVGRPYRIDSTLINPSRADLPGVGTLVGWLAQRDGYAGAVPPYVITPFPHCDSTVYITPGQYGGCLGAKYDPFVLNADPNAADFRPAFAGKASPPPDQLADRRRLLKDLDSSPLTDPGLFREVEVNRQKALSLVGSAQVRKAFDLSLEPPATRDRYGRHSWGQSHLLARRLVEAGCKFVTTVNGPSIVWDTHKDNFKQMESRLVPPMEQAFATLLEDLHDRGLLDSTLVVWLGDFGRTPTINADAGRDHWPQCYSAVLAGGGIRGGQVVGSSDAIGAFPKDFPVTPADLHATVFTALGYDPHAITYQSADGRPFPLSEGTAIRQLL